jgi:hypothetical protein
MEHNYGRNEQQTKAPAGGGIEYAICIFLNAIQMMTQPKFGGL